MASCFRFFVVFGTDAVVFEMVGAGGLVAVVPECHRPFRVAAKGVVGSEEHGGVTAVEGWILVVIACDICEVLHADL